MTLDRLDITLAVIIGTLAAIVYSLRILVLMERRVARVEMHIEKIAEKMIQEEIKIEKEIGGKKKKNLFLFYFKRFTTQTWQSVYQSKLH